MANCWYQSNYIFQERFCEIQMFNFMLTDLLANSVKCMPCHRLRPSDKSTGGSRYSQISFTFSPCFFKNHSEYAAGLSAMGNFLNRLHQIVSSIAPRILSLLYASCPSAKVWCIKYRMSANCRRRKNSVLQWKLLSSPRWSNRGKRPYHAAKCGKSVEIAFVRVDILD